MPDAMPIRPVLTRAECGQASMTARLSRENWNEMTSAARASKNHPGKLDRWVERAEMLNPALDAAQAERLARRLRRAHFQNLARARWARQSAYRAQADERAS